MRGAKLLARATVFLVATSAAADQVDSVSLTQSLARDQWCVSYEERTVCMPSVLDVESVAGGIIRMGVPQRLHQPFLHLQAYTSEEEILNLESEYEEHYGGNFILIDEHDIEIRIYRAERFYSGIVPIGRGLVFLVVADSLDEVDAIASDLAKQWAEQSSSAPAPVGDASIPCDQYFHAGCIK